MSEPRIKWKQVSRYFERRGYAILPAKGGDKKIVAPKGVTVKRNIFRIGHKYCSHGDELLPAHLAAIERAFGVTADQIRQG